MNLDEALVLLAEHWPGAITTALGPELVDLTETQARGLLMKWCQNRPSAGPPSPGELRDEVARRQRIADKQHDARRRIRGPIDGGVA